MKKKYQPSLAFKGSSGLFVKLCLSICITILTFSACFSQEFPDGFNQTSVVKTLDNPTAIAFAPDGRIFVAEQGAILRVIKNGNLLPDPSIEIEPEAKGNKSIVGITFDPDFRNNDYIYLYYIVISTRHARVSRFKVNEDIIQKESEEIVLEIDEVKPDINHNGGQMQFGTDGKLYIATGDLYKAEQAQDLNNYHGKIIRINPDGSIPSGNPFTGTDDSEQKKRIWAYGIRNGFTFDIQPGTGKLFVNDVGSDYYEEINDATTGGLNFGWPAEEGPGQNPAYVSPLYSYKRILEPGNDHGCAITGGVFYNPAATNYPAAYKGKYFFQEYCNGWIAMLDLASGAVKIPFATDLGKNMMYLTVGTDGNLYYLSRNGKNSILYKITYTRQEAPQITNQPDDITVNEGESVTFTVNATGTAPLQYQWQKNTKDIPGATAATYAISKAKPQDAGQYRVIVTNPAGNITSRAAILSVSTQNKAPVAIIISPANGSLYEAGQVLSFEGAATDEEDGELAESAFSWDVVFHHNTHTHEMPAVSNGKKKGSIVIPNTGESEISVWYRLYLTVTDSKGIAHKIYRDIYPRTSTISFATEPEGLAVTLDGKSLATPTSVKGVEGLLRSIGTEASQMLNGTQYIFERWEHGGNRIQTIDFPEDNLTYTAVFKPVLSLRNPENPANTVNGLNYSYYEGAWNSLPDFNSLSGVKSGAVSTITLQPAGRENNFAFRFTGYLQVPADGEYTFYTSSDDGSQFYIGNTLIVDNNGLHSAVERSGKIGLKTGKHAFSVTYFERSADEILQVSYKGPGIAKQFIPASAFYHIKSDVPDDMVTVKVNFQPATSKIPSGYLADIGESFANRGNDFAYGWNQPTFHTRDRGTIANSDSRYATLNHMQKEPQAGAIWEIALPDGNYQVKVVSSDPFYTNQLNHFLIENELILDEDGYDAVDTYQLTVQVSDGRLTIKPGPDAVNAKISFVDITQVSAVARVASDSRETSLQMDVFPNPVADKLSVKLTTSQAGQVRLTLTNALSRPVQGQVYYLSKGEQILNLPVQGLKAGSYLLQVSTPSHSFTKRITIIR